jgi:hypothetical protein
MRKPTTEVQAFYQSKHHLHFAPITDTNMPYRSFPENEEWWQTLC